ncbi:MAG: hypothetical protein IJE44_00825 [Clostridia bacterium]|nr:hypothetical protein [Clostridia bacterium]
MGKRAILNFRNSYEEIFGAIRRSHMKRLVEKLKKGQSEKYVLTEEMEKEAKSFWDKYKSVPMIYHNFYTEKNGEFHKEYIPDEIYYNYIQPHFNNYRLAKALDNKCYYHKMFPGIAQPKLVAYRMNGFWYIDDQVVTKFEDVYNVLKNEKEVFIKRATDSGGGHGVKYLNCEGLTQEQFEKEIKDFTGDVAIQRGITQHEVLGKINPTSVNTIRIITLLEKEGAKVLSIILRMGVGETKVDNSSSGGMTIGVSMDGKLKKYACADKRRLLDTHPTSNIVFEGYELPSFDRVKELVLKASYMVPHFRMVAWDVSVLEDGTPVLIEANLYDGQLDSHQIHNGPLFKEDTERIMNEVFNK